jgi:hypothetical protein
LGGFFMHSGTERMATWEQFPAEAIEILRETKWSPLTKRTFDGMAGGFVWDDEFPQEALDACTRQDNWSFRAVIAYRASLIAGEPREELRAPWDQLACACPEWPGFRPERRSSELRAPMERANERFMSSIRRTSKLLDDRLENPGAIGSFPTH